MATLRVSGKIEAATRVLKGESPADVAKSLGVEPERIEKWHKLFVSAGKRALRYTQEPDERPQAADVLFSAQKAFPRRLLHGIDTAICFFTSHFFGKNDVVHFWDLGVPKVTVVDLDAEKLAHMKTMYPPEWDFVTEDAFEAARRLAREGRKFDLVCSDPFTSLAPSVLLEHHQEFKAITGKHMLYLVTRKMLDEFGSGEDLDKLREVLSKRVDPDMKVVNLIKRSDHVGGIFWLHLSH